MNGDSSGAAWPKNRASAPVEPQNWMVKLI